MHVSCAQSRVLCLFLSEADLSVRTGICPTLFPLKNCRFVCRFVAAGVSPVFGGPRAAAATARSRTKRTSPQHLLLLLRPLRLRRPKLLLKEARPLSPRTSRVHLTPTAATPPLVSTATASRMKQPGRLTLCRLHSRLLSRPSPAQWPATTLLSPGS